MLQLACQCELGEGPVWLEQSQQLFWVDILGKCLHTFSPYTLVHQQTDLAEMPAAAVPIQGREDLLVATDRSFLRFHPVQGRIERLDEFPERDPNIRANDGKCDPSGNFWIGSMDTRGEKGRGKLFQIHDNLSEKVILGSLTIPNGLAWNQQGDRMYFIDSPSQEIKVFDFDAKSGQQGALSAVIPFSVEWGIPDGMTIDRNDHLWVACWGGSRVVCLDSLSGELVATVSVPVPHVTSCTFGGKDLNTLYITTAMDRENQSGFAGAVFSCEPGVSGLAPHAFQLT